MSILDPDHPETGFGPCARHVLPSFFTGKLSDRFGVVAIITFGSLLNLSAMTLDLSWVTLENFWIALAFLGTGWSLMSIGGAALLAESYPPEERAKVQAPNDFPVFATVSVFGFSSGALYLAYDWSTVNWALAAPMVLASLSVAGLKWPQASN